MVNVNHQKCGNEGCSTTPSYGVAGTRKAEFCAQHARAGMVNVNHQTCGNEGCSIMPSYGVAGSRKAEFCAQHPRTGTVDVCNRKCGNEGCSRQPTYGVVGTRKAEIYAQHTRTGTVAVRKKKCGNEGCSARPSYGVAGSRKADFCAQHARVGMVHIKSKKCGNKGCSNWGKYQGKFCRQHAAELTADVSDADERARDENNCNRGVTEDRADVVVARWGRKRDHPVGGSSPVNDGVGSRRNMRAGTRRGGRTLPLTSVQSAPGPPDV